MQVTSSPRSSSSRARFQPTLPAPAMIVYTYSAPSAACWSCSMAIWVGQIVVRPCSEYQAARRGSSTRATTRGTSNRRWAICDTTRFVLSPFVEAMNTSASSMPASSSASTSSAVPIVKRPPASSQERPSSTSRRSCDSGSSSRTETVWPARRADVATDDPTRPAPTTSTYTALTLASVAAPVACRRVRDATSAGVSRHVVDIRGVRGRMGHRQRVAHRHLGRRGLGAHGVDPGRAAVAVGAVAVRRRRGEDDAARRLVDDVARRLADERVVQPLLAAQPQATAHPRWLLGGEHDRLHAAALGLVDDRLPRPARPHDGGRDLDALVLLPHRLRALERAAGPLELLLGHARVERQGHRHLEDPQRLDHGAALAVVVVLVGGQP